jgi:hypothetical protein
MANEGGQNNAIMMEFSPKTLVVRASAESW